MFKYRRTVGKEKILIEELLVPTSKLLPDVITSLHLWLSTVAVSDADPYHTTVDYAVLTNGVHSRSYHNTLGPTVEKLHHGQQKG